MNRIGAIPANAQKALVIIAISAIAALAACGLCSCAGSPAKESASKISVSAALGSTYQTAVDAVRQKADDAKLLAIRSSSYCSDGNPSEWMYLFYSFNKAYAYTAFVSNGEATVADSGPMAISSEEFAAIPDSDAIAVDAPDAWKAVVSALDGEGKIYTTRIFLMTFITEDSDPTQDAMQWFFSVNEGDNLSSFFEGNSMQTDDNCQARLFSVNSSDASVKEEDASLLATE